MAEKLKPAVQKVEAYLNTKSEVGELQIIKAFQFTVNCDLTVIYRVVALALGRLSHVSVTRDCFPPPPPCSPVLVLAPTLQWSIKVSSVMDFSAFLGT